MRTRMSTVGNVLVLGGALVGVATVAAIATGQEIVLTPEMIQLVIYKVLGIAAIGLMIVGTWIGRRGREKEVAKPEPDPLLAEPAFRFAEKDTPRSKDHDVSDGVRDSKQ